VPSNKFSSALTSVERLAASTDPGLKSTTNRPVKAMNITSPTLNQPSTFCTNIPVRRKHPCIIVIEVNSPTAKVFCRMGVGSARSAKRTYSPKTMQLLAVNPNNTEFTAIIVDARKRGLLYVNSRYTFVPDSTHTGDQPYVLKARLRARKTIPPDLGNIHPYSRLIAKPAHEINAPTTHNTRLSPILPVSLTMAPGVAKIPLPITREMMRIKAPPHPRLRPTTLVSGSTSFSTERERLRSGPRSSTTEMLE
jgi:hypothetical protein